MGEHELHQHLGFAAIEAERDALRHELAEAEATLASTSRTLLEVHGEELKARARIEELESELAESQAFVISLANGGADRIEELEAAIDRAYLHDITLTELREVRRRG